MVNAQAGSFRVQALAASKSQGGLQSGDGSQESPGLFLFHRVETARAYLCERLDCGWKACFADLAANRAVRPVPSLKGAFDPSAQGNALGYDWLSQISFMP